MDGRHTLHTTKPILACPYCESTAVIRRGTRAKKHGPVQLFSCHFCGRKFTPLITKHRTYPLRIIVETLSRYNRLQPLAEVQIAMRRKFGITVPLPTARRWIREFAPELPFLRLREAAKRKRPAHQAIVAHRLLHGQVYDFLYHRTKLELILDLHFENRPFAPLKDYLESIPESCPHELFRNTTTRGSQATDAFPIADVRVTPKAENTAVALARFALQSVGKNTLRHPTIQEFLLVNDSVTVAVEVPIVLTAADLRHYRDILGFTVPISLKPGETLTGHIDAVQIRNGAIHILDYKPDARKIKPIGQLMVYALALARRTGLRLADFRCAWFDDRDYFAFAPLHVVHRKRAPRIPQPTHVHLQSGTDGR